MRSFILEIKLKFNQFRPMNSNILSQSYSAGAFYFDNISFLEHVLNQLFLPNESSISQASYRTMVLTICFQLFKTQPYYGGRVVEKMKSMVMYQYPTCDMHSCSVKDVLISEIPFGILDIFKR